MRKIKKEKECDDTRRKKKEDKKNNAFVCVINTENVKYSSQLSEDLSLGCGLIIFLSIAASRNSRFWRTLSNCRRTAV